MHRLLTSAVGLAVLMASVADAAESDKPAAARATDTHARVPQQTYHSAFTGYQPYRPPDLAPWREMNDQAHVTGGHTGMVRGAGGRPAGHHPQEHRP